jgi:hypothetical protein
MNTRHIYSWGWKALLVGTIGFASCSYYTQKRPLKLYNQAIKKGLSYDAAIVPGYPFDGQAWDTLVKARVLWAVHLYHKGIVRNIIFSGGAVHTPYIEAQVMGRYAEALGIPAQHIYYETRAEHSTENIYYSYLLAQQEGFKSLALCTDPIQSILLKQFTNRRFGSPVAHLPFVRSVLESVHVTDPKIDTAGLKVDNFTPLKSRESRWQSIRGTMGSGIDWNGQRVLPPL